MPYSASAAGEGHLDHRDGVSKQPIRLPAMTVDLGTETVLLDIVDGVATITLNRPKVNALNMEMQRGIRRAALECAVRTEVAAVVLTGGERTFAAGVDIKEMAAMSHADMAAHAPVMHAAFDAVAAIPKPVVAAVTGYALGGGCELMLCADVRFAANNAIFGQPEIKLGLIPGAGGTQRLPRLIGVSRAKDLVFTGRNVAADEALAIGLVNQLFSAEQVIAEATVWARQFVGGPALALRAAKTTIDAGMQADLATGLALERVAFSSLFATQDRMRGMESFLTQGPGKAEFVGY